MNWTYLAFGDCVRSCGFHHFLKWCGTLDHYHSRAVFLFSSNAALQHLARHCRYFHSPFHLFLEAHKTMSSKHNIHKTKKQCEHKKCIFFMMVNLCHFGQDNK